VYGPFFHGGNTGSNSVGDAKSFSTTSAIFIFENVGLERFDKDFRFEGVAAEEIDGAAVRGCGEPCRGIIRDARLRPLFECGGECFLREIHG